MKLPHAGPQPHDKELAETEAKHQPHHLHGLQGAGNAQNGEALAFLILIHAV